MSGADGAAGGRADASPVSPALGTNDFPEALAEHGGRRGVTGFSSSMRQAGRGFPSSTTSKARSHRV
ncbi:hypothetical protein PJI17_11840 [Mycobacterium kansasii]